MKKVEVEAEIMYNICYAFVPVGAPEDYMGFFFEYMKLSLPWIVMFTAVWIPARVLYITGRRKRTGAVASRTVRETASHEVFLWLFGVSLTVILSQTLTVDGSPSFFVPKLRTDGEYLNLIPLRSLRRLKNTGTAAESRFFMVNILGNIAVFVPLGAFFAAAFGRKIPGTALFCAAVSLAVELAQLFMPRAADIDDIILNTAGGVAGAALCAAVRAAMAGIRKKRGTEVEEKDEGEGGGAQIG